jgi:hypothetical protein
MALAFTRTLFAAIATTTCNAAATILSAENDGGDNTLFEQIRAFLTVTGFATTPVGNMQIGLHPLHTTSGTVFDDRPNYAVFTVTADAQYDFSTPLSQMPRYCKVAVFNNTTQNTDASAVSAWLEYTKVTA